MVFSSTLFLFFFLPVVLGAYALAPRGARNALLLAASLVFYAWGEAGYVLLLLGSIVINHAVGLRLRAGQDTSPRRGVLALGIALNLILLGAFKYANFAADSWNVMVGAMGLGSAASIELAPIHLPIGISFFTFQAISYLVDVHRGHAPVERSLLRVALYISLFPQLIAGPIVRFASVASALRERSVDLAGYHAGLRRFVRGLAKKMLIANPLGEVADAIFALPPGELGAQAAWLGAVCYALQIFFDFSGYSDMAIGLGRLFGFTFPENFRFPYVAASIREFWRRWHISLSTWFRDYLYIPLGGSRRGGARTALNLLVVFFLCGLWHGASANFVVWGLFHGAFLALERGGFGRLLARAWRPLRHGYALLVVLVGWVVFRAETLPQALHHLAVMFGLSRPEVLVEPARYYVDASVGWALLVGVLISMPTAAGAAAWMRQAVADRGDRGPAAWAFVGARLATTALLLLAAAASVASSTYNPFIYFRF